MVVKLDEVEFWSACYAGLLLHSLSLKMGLTERMKKPGGDPVRIQQVGQLGERVAAKALDLYWSGAARTYAGADLSHNIEVRTTGNPKWGPKVRSRDADKKRVVCVHIPGDLSAREFEVLGWILAGDAKLPQWWVDPYGKGGFYSVPPAALRDIYELQHIIRTEQLP